MLVGDVRDASVLIVDDLIAGGGTIARATEALNKGGARQIIALASHGQFCGEALSRLAQLPLAAVAVTNSLPQAQGADKLQLVDCAPLIAEAIRRLHGGEAASDLSF
jgi:ribose-phosphate pyrophosphokinase